MTKGMYICNICGFDAYNGNSKSSKCKLFAHIQSHGKNKNYVIENMILNRISVPKCVCSY